ncbi:integrin beta-PS-like [Oratosquilla oratoria]|uniref:integrin beta-PS-like n=1 Tax=Oratosquilla oratoria TaxID=337810 RepID=UPI003F7701D6
MFSLGSLKPRSSAGAGLLFVPFLLLGALMVQEATAQQRVNKCGEAVGEPSQQDISRCAHQDDQCHKCIQIPGCQWCSRVISPTQEGGSGAKNSSNRHCFPTSFDLSSVCSPEDIEVPCNEAHKIRDEPLSEVIKGKKVQRKIIQIRPQHVRLDLRKGTPYNLTLKFRQVSDHPVDLYYLMDLSNSMGDDKENLSRLGSLLAKTMRALTSQFRLGFGSFVDKVALPFVNTHPKRLQEPCTGCAPPFTFINNLKLNENDKLFTLEVINAQISGNQDSPEGGFDALMQAIVCQDIGWRNASRKIIIFSTDAKFHQAGDGRLAGIVTPNDGLCHLDARGHYTNGLMTDYPSISQINKKVQEHQVNIIFAATEGNIELYRELSNHIAYSSYGVMDRSSSNIVELVKEQYKKITSTIKLSTLSHSSESIASVRMFSSCLDGGPPKQISMCDGLREGDEVEFLVEITADQCLEEDKESFFEITTGLDRVRIDLNIECDCECEKEGGKERIDNSDMCSDAGTLQCGVCACNPGSYGKNCQCNSENTHATQEHENLCRKGNDTQLCSGKGVCQCGQCSCRQPSTMYEDIWGTHCECNRRKCRNQGKLCSNNGECECNSCRCNQGWQGQFCNCPADDICIADGGSEVCSGHGTCACGRCQCLEVDNVPYTGKFCEECPTCPKTKCAEYQDCVLCLLYDIGKLDEAECRKCTIRPIPTESLQEEIDRGASLCTYVHEDSYCEYQYTYFYNAATESYEIFAKSEPNCPEVVFLAGIVFGVIGAIVAIGLLTLIIWKILTTIHDKREFAKFEEERNKAKWSTAGNPLYQPATNTFENPVFGS